jgi:type III pantothenate kinase
MNLLVDIGNTRVKWAVDNQKGEITPSLAIEHKNPDFEKAIEQLWQTLKTPECLAISSVVSKQHLEKIITLAQQFWPEIKVVIAESSAQYFSVSNAYSQPKKLGVDRWLSLIALHYYYPDIRVVTDCGTAITIDVINSNGEHLGGLICPGIQLMKQSLYQNAEALILSEKHYPAVLSNSTESAIYTGTLYAAAGLIEKTMEQLCHSNRCVLTGGDAQLLQAHLKVECIVEVDFVLKGLLLYCKEEGK